MKMGIASALDEIIDGKFVSRNVHELNFEKRDLTHLFIERLRLHGFVEKRVGEIELKFDERLPAFVIKNGKAYFGWVFVERFTQTKSRKLFGSVVRNNKGDWLIQVPQNSRESIYVNYHFKTEMESDGLFVIE